MNALEAEQQKTAGDAEVAQTVQRILADAQRRSQLLAETDQITAGYDKGFFIRSDNGDFTLRPGVLLQFRSITNARVGGGDDDAIENGFELRRLRPRIDGNAFSPDFTYSIVLDASRTNGNVSLLDAWVQYRLDKNWAIKARQFRNSWVHEGDVPDSSQLTVERSLIDALLAGSQTDRVQGVALIYGGVGDLPVRTEFAFHDGDNSKNTNFQDVNANFGASARGEYKLLGDWGDYRDFSARTTRRDLLVLGAGADYSQFGDADVLRTTIDAQYELPTRWAFYAALNGNIRRDDDSSDFDWGALAQAGYAIDRKWEPFVRYDMVSIDDGGIDAFNEFAVGVNYFPDDSAGHRAKFTFDVLYLPDGVPSDQTGIGALQSDDAQFILRGQFQLLL